LFVCLFCASAQAGGEPPAAEPPIVEALGESAEGPGEGEGEAGVGSGSAPSRKKADWRPARRQPDRAQPRATTGGAPAFALVSLLISPPTAPRLGVLVSRPGSHVPLSQFFLSAVLTRGPTVFSLATQHI
jgi:hypothetical protein